MALPKLKDVLAMREDGASYNKIARHFHVGESTLKKFLVANDSFDPKTTGKKQWSKKERALRAEKTRRQRERREENKTTDIIKVQAALDSTNGSTPAPPAYPGQTPVNMFVQDPNSHHPQHASQDWLASFARRHGFTMVVMVPND